MDNTVRGGLTLKKLTRNGFVYQEGTTQTYNEKVSDNIACTATTRLSCPQYYAKTKVPSEGCLGGISEQGEMAG